MRRKGRCYKILSAWLKKFRGLIEHVSQKENNFFKYAMNISIKEKSWIAWIAAKVLRTNKVAIVFGHTIHLWNTGRNEFLQNRQWVRHEIAHIEQYKKHGFAGFIFLYLAETIKRGYYKNRFEVEARSRENEPLPENAFS